MRNKKPLDILLWVFTWVSAALTVLVLFSIVLYIVVKGVPHLKPSLFSLHYTSENVSLLPSLISTILMTVISLCISVPLGVFTGIYLVEYAKRGSKIVELIRVTSETLSGIPSIIYGLFGMLFFVTYLGMGFSVLAGALTLAIMILPLIIRTTEEALQSVPDNYREGAYGLGAGKMRTIFKIVLPAAVPGILAGIILAVGRIVGETAALIYTAGTYTKLPDSLWSSARTLSVHMYALSSEGFHTNEAYATAVVILIIVIAINTFSAYIAKKIAKGK